MQVSQSKELGDAERQWAEWMARAQAGDRAAYEHLLRTCIPFIRRVARNQGVGPDGLDDVVQETLLSIHRARHTYDPGRSVMAWLSMIAQRRAIDALRRQTLHRREVHAPTAYENYADHGGCPDAATSALGDAAWLAAAVQALPLRQREAVNLLVFQSRSLASAAIAAGRSTGSLRVSWHRALRTLQAQFGRQE
jgi:RNA polymerase sigma-70 factor (ECF subfamily)